MLLGLSFLFVTSETVFANLKVAHSLLGLLGRLRTFVLAWGIVNYWRAIWYIWDESFGTSQWSCWVCHLAPLGILVTMGCMACLLAPASTMGVDVVPHPHCADEPLFSYLPVPAEDLTLFGIARHPQVLSEESLTQRALAFKKSFVQMSMLEFSDMLDVDDYISNKQQDAAANSHHGSVELTRKETEATELNQLNEDTAHGGGKAGSDTPPTKTSDDEVEAVDDDDAAAAPQPMDMEAGVSPAEDEDAALAKFAASLAAPSHDSEDAAAEEADMAAAWADIEAKLGTKTASNEALSASSAWASGGTGKRASYSSVRTPGEQAEHRPSYLDLQRPDLDRRVSHRASEEHRSSVRGSLQGSLRASSAGNGTRSSLRRSSDLFRSR